ncbi:MAG: V-type ATP synthase subunit K [Candidatus Nanohalobium sp.]
MAAEAAATGASQFAPVGAGLAIGLSALATGWAQAKIGSAGVGALAEDDSLFGNVLILLVIPETAVIFGLVVALVATGFI